jgi:PHD/YefM family antitoxin component YafN of YafNO toxin-antitoxin module
MTAVASKGGNLEALADQVITTRERVVVEQDGRPSVVMMAASELDGLEYSIDLLSEPKVVRRIIEGEAALQSGNLLMGQDLSVLDPNGRFVLRAVTGGVNQAAGSLRGDRWMLVASEPSAKALDALAFHVADAVRQFIFGPLLDDPIGLGVELQGFLARRLATKVETALVVYRLDSVRRAVRLVEILNFGGVVGGHDARRW